MNKTNDLRRSVKEGGIWIDEVDYLRGLAVLAVITIHTLVVGNSPTILAVVNVFASVFFQFAVRLFVLISGVVLSLRYGHAFSVRSFYGRRWKSVVPQYLVFSFLYLLFDAIRGASPTVEDVIFKVLTANSRSHLWFVAVIIQLYILYPLLIRLYYHFFRRGWEKIFLLFCLSAQLLWIVFVTVLEDTIVGESALARVNVVLHRVFLFELFYFVLGIHVGQHLAEFRDRLRSMELYKVIAIPVALAVLLSWIWMGGYFYGIPEHYRVIVFVLAPALYVPMFVLCYTVSNCLIKGGNLAARVVYRFGRLAFGIYLIHELFRYTTAYLLSRINIVSEDWIYYPLVFMATAILSYFSVYVIGHLPHSKRVVGVSLPDALGQGRKG